MITQKLNRQCMWGYTVMEVIDLTPRMCQCNSLSFTGDVTISEELTVNSDLNGLFTLTCISTGGPATTVTWTRDNVDVSGGNTVLTDPVMAKYTHTLTVTAGGEYTCTVTNGKPSTAMSDSFNLEGILFNELWPFIEHVILLFRSSTSH